jgi:hypothetical protein
VDRCHGNTESPCDVFGGDCLKFVGLKVQGQRNFEVLGMLTEVQNAPNYCFYWAEDEGLAAAMVNHFTLHQVLLAGEGEGDASGSAECGSWNGEEVAPLVADPSKEDLDVFEAERIAIFPVAGVFTRAQQEEESDGNHVSSGLGSVGAPVQFECYSRCNATNKASVPR